MFSSHFPGDLSSISGSESDSEDLDSDAGGTTTNFTGTDTESSADTSLVTGRLCSRVVFQNSLGQYLSVYRCILLGKVRLKSFSTASSMYVDILLINFNLISVFLTFQSNEEQDAASLLMSVGRKTVWVILMTGGGHFAGAVFQG